MQNYKKIAESFRVKLKPIQKRWLHPNGESGIYNCVPLEVPEGDLRTNRRGEFCIKGNLPYELKIDKPYVVYLFGSPEYNDKFGSFTYKIDKFEVEQLTLPEEQFEFLSTVANENIYNQLEKLYEGQLIIDLIFEDKIDLTKIQGLKEKSYAKLKEKLEMYRDLGKLQNLLRPLGVTIRSVKKIANHFGNPDTAYYKVKESIYNICEVSGFGFSKVDEIALKAGTDPRDELRIKYCLGYLLEQGAQNGHSWDYRENLKIEAIDLLKIEPLYVDNYLDKSLYVKGEYYDKTDIIVVGDLVSTFGMYYDERNTLDNLDYILKSYVPMSDDQKYFDQQIDDVQESLGIIYTQEQRNAILNGLKHGVYIIEGLAGTGKTTIIKAIAQIQAKRGVRTVAVALSGKAANILYSKGLNAATIHRTLGYNGDGFAHRQGKPIPYGWVNLDEAGMASAWLWNALTSAIPEKAQFIISGDAGQLAAIGAGDIMRDILGSIRYPKVELKQIHRQAQDSGVIEVAHKVRHGESITGYNHEMNKVFGVNEDLQIISQFKPRKDDVILHEFMTEEQEKEAFNPIYVTAKKWIEAKVSQIKLSTDPERELLDFQILCPTKAGSIGVDSINRYFQHLYNDNKEGITKGNTTFKKGDKVINNGNTYGTLGYESLSDFLHDKPIVEDNKLDPETIAEMEEEGIYINEEDLDPVPVGFDLFNGTLGIIRAVYPDRQKVVVQFEGIDALIAIATDELDSLDLGYAITIHKSQGSSIPNVLILFDFSAFKLLSKQLLYTALTRTSTGKCIVICENNALFKATQIDSSGNRRTFMKLFLEHLDSQVQQEEKLEEEK